MTRTTAFFDENGTTWMGRKMRQDTLTIRSIAWKQSHFLPDRKSTRHNSTLSLHDALPIYDQNNGLLRREWNDVDGEENETRYTYDSLDRVETVSFSSRSEEHTPQLHSFPTRRSSDL